MDPTTISNKDYVDALNVERNRTDTAWRWAIGGMFFSILQATAVLAKTFEKRMDTTNEWRGALEDQTKEKATVQQIEQIQKEVGEIKAALATIADKAAGGKIYMGNVVQNLSSVGTLVGIVYLIIGGGK